MATPKALHLEAQRLFQLAEFGESTEAERLQLLEKAFALESEAALLLRDRWDAEPTRSVLCRSASALALRCGKLEEAERLACLGLAGHPPEAIREELLDLMNTATARHHLRKRSLEIPSNGVLLSIAGKGYAPGYMDPKCFTSRIDDTQRLLIRSYERLQGWSFRSRGQPSGKAMASTQFVLGTPQAASFAVSILFPAQQPDLWGNIDIDLVLESTFEDLDAFEKDDLELLQSRIPDTDYLINFLALAGRLAPDGHDITSVGFRSTNRRTSHELVMVRTRHKTWRPAGSDKSTIVSLDGLLQHADVRARGTRSTIRLTQGSQKTKDIEVPGGLDEIVAGLWSKQVTATVRIDKNQHTLVRIHESKIQ